mmetsp:Transcript_81242/g.230139  ORF Transcript_81242/g.230139 Transcript_81242/m.230139 type:complete len:243 (-) Transcript_81242:357-1085(-)
MAARLAKKDTGGRCPQSAVTARSLSAFARGPGQSVGWRPRLPLLLGLSCVSGTILKKTGPPADEASAVTQPFIFFKFVGVSSFGVHTGILTMPSCRTCEAPTCSTISPQDIEPTASLSSSGPARTMMSPLLDWYTALHRGACARMRYCGPPALEASAVTQPQGWMGIRMHPCPRPPVSTLGAPFCWSISPGAVRRISVLSNETPPRITRSSRRDVRTRHHAPRWPLPQETVSLCSGGSPSEM